MQCKTRHKLVVAGSGLRITFANYVLSAQGELKTAGANGYYDFILRAGVKINGVFYPLTVNGVRDVTVPFGTFVTFDPLPISWTAGTMLTVYNRRTAVNQSATNYNVLASHGASTGFGEGTLSSTIAAGLDYTTGGMPGGDIADFTFTNVSGALTPTVGANKGSGYTSTPSFSVLDPTAYGTTNAASPVTNSAVSASGQPTITVSSTTNVAVGMLVGGHASIPAGATVASFVANTSITLSANLTGAIAVGVTIGVTIPSGGAGAGFAATATQSGGALTGVVSQTGKGFNYSSRTVMAMTGGGGFGANTQAYGPAMITGVPTSKCVSLEFMGNSITRGVGANDAIGDENRAFGITERAFKSAYPSINIAYIGNELVAISGNNYALTYAMVQSVLTPTHVFVCNGTNDFAAGFSLANVQGWLGTIIAREKALGKKVIVETTPPRTTSTDGWTTVANQTPVVTSPVGAFTAGGIVDQYDNWLIAGSSGADYVIDVRPATRDTTNTDRWRTDFGKASSDGIHPLQTDRIALALAAQATRGIPALTV